MVLATHYEGLYKDRTEQDKPHKSERQELYHIQVSGGTEENGKGGRDG